MRIRTSKSEAMVFSTKPMECLLRVGNEFYPQVKDIEYFKVLYTSEGTMEVYRVVGAVLQSLYCTIVTNRELSRKAKLSSYRSIFFTSLTMVVKDGA